MKQIGAVLTVVLSSLAMLAQDIQVNRQNKTISVTAEESAEADAEIAVLGIGYHNFAPNQDAAFQENVRIANQITKALVDVKIPKAAIETEKLRLGRTEGKRNGLRK